MTDPFLDQIEAARADARRTVADALGIDENWKIPHSADSIAENMFDQLKGDRRCRHLIKVPAQPSYWGALAGWECKRCSIETAAARRRLGPKAAVLGVVEEFTCDRCRRYTLRELEIVVCRLDFWTMILGCCPRCVQDFKAAGGKEVEPE